MTGIKKLFIDFIEGYATKEGVNSLIITVCVVVLVLFISKLLNGLKMSDLYKIGTIRKKEDLGDESIFEHLGYLESLKKSSLDYVKYSKKTKKYQKYYLGILSLEVAIVIGGLFFGKLILGVMLAVVIHFSGIMVLRTSSRKMEDIVREELPMIVKHFVKILSRTSDLKIAIYETSKHMKNPLKSKFENLSRRMLSENEEKCLEEFAEDVDSIWMYAFVFLILSMKEQSKKEDVLVNLKVLAEMLDDGNTTRAKEMAEKKPMILMNTMIAILAIIALVANLAFNETASVFFFGSLVGMGLFLLGVGAIIATFIINVSLNTRTGGE